MSVRTIIVVLVLSVASVPAPALAQDEPRGFISVNFGVQPPAEETLTDGVIFPYRRETAIFGAEYPIERAFSFDVGGGGFFLPWLGVGAAVNRTSDERSANVAASVPHPTQFNRNASDSGDTQEAYGHSETGIHLNAIVRVPTGPRANVLFFGGPSFIRVKQDLVSDVTFNELLLFNAYVINITGVRRTEFDATATGFNVGTDLGFFFTDNIGVGGLLRYTRATYELESALARTAGAFDVSGLLEKPKAGGVTAAGGVRFKF